MTDKTRLALVACIDALTPPRNAEERDALNCAEDALVSATLIEHGFAPPAPLDTIAPEPTDTPPALFPMAEPTVEAALCLWEAAIELKDAADADGTLLTCHFEQHGTPTMRHAVMQLAPDCCDEWDGLGEDGQEQMAPFDWEFVPEYLRRALRDTRLQTAIENQCRKPADQLPIEAKPA